MENFILCLIYMCAVMYLEMSVIYGYTAALSADKCTPREIFLLYYKGADFKNYKYLINISMVFSLRGCFYFHVCLISGRILDFLCSSVCVVICHRYPVVNEDVCYVTPVRVQGVNKRRKIQVFHSGSSILERETCC